MAQNQNVIVGEILRQFAAAAEDHHFVGRGIVDNRVASAERTGGGGNQLRPCRRSTDSVGEGENPGIVPDRAGTDDSTVTHHEIIH